MKGIRHTQSSRCQQQQNNHNDTTNEDKSHILEPGPAAAHVLEPLRPALCLELRRDIVITRTCEEDGMNKNMSLYVWVVMIFTRLPIPKIKNNLSSNTQTVMRELTWLSILPFDFLHDRIPAGARLEHRALPLARRVQLHEEVRVGVAVAAARVWQVKVGLIIVVAGPGSLSHTSCHFVKRIAFRALLLYKKAKVRYYQRNRKDEAPGALQFPNLFTTSGHHAPISSLSQ